MSRDPIEEFGGCNFYSFVANSPLGFVDPYGLRQRLSKSDGENSLRSGLALLGTACDKAAQSGNSGCCSAATCKEESKNIVEALVAAWNRNYGNGPIDDSVPGQPSVGGYMCWDWANIFEDALSPLHLKCASFQEGIAATGMLILNGEPGRRVHYFVKIYVGNMDVDSMRVNFDDGFIEGKAANPGAFPMNSQYQEINRADYPGLSRPSYNPFIPAIPNPYVTETASWPGKHPPPSS
jgi:hypothetical protein